MQLNRVTAIRGEEESRPKWGLAYTERIRHLTADEPDAIATEEDRPKLLRIK